KEPDNDLARANQAVFLMRLGDVALELNGDARAARDYYARGRALRQEIADHPRSRHFTDQQNRIALSHFDVRVGRADLALGAPAAARKDFEQALAYRKGWVEAEPGSAEARSYLSEVYLWLATADWRRGDFDASETASDESLRLSAKLAEEFGKEFSFRSDLAE